MVGEGGHPLDPVEALRAMVALRDSDSSSTAKRLYALAKPGTVNGRVARYILENEAFTVDVLVDKLGIPRNTLYGVIREFVRWGIIHPVYKIDIGHSGTKAVMYVLDKADLDKIDEARRLHLVIKSKEMLVVDSRLKEHVRPYVLDAIKHGGLTTANLIPEDFIRQPFLQERGYYSDEIRQAVHHVAEEMGYTIRYSSL